MADIYESRFARTMQRIARDHNDVFAVTTGPECTRYTCKSYQVPILLRRHEECHKRQYQAYGSRIRFWFAYFRASIRYGYVKNPFEVAARAVETETL